MQNFINRLKEPSTFAGLSVLLGLFGVQVAPELATGAVQTLTGLAALAAIFMREKGNV